MNGLIAYVILVLLSSVDCGNVVKQISPKDIPYPSSSTGNKVQGRIVSGNHAAANQFPFQVSLKSVSGSTASICGGSILSANYILTAAHCTRGYSKFEIGIGSIYLNTPSFRVTSFSKKEHPDFNPAHLTNDIALIKLPSPISFGRNVSPIQLPRVSQASTTFLNERGIVSGYGRLVDNSTHVSPVLNFVDMRIISRSECAGIFGTRIVTNNVICARGAKDVHRNACMGDSGGPLAIVEDGEDVQIGLVSFVSSRGCSFGDPSGYTRIGKYLNWISKQTGIPLRT